MPQQKALFICNTYYQLIVALILRFTELRDNNDVSIVISDMSNNTEIVTQRLKSIGCFKNVYYAHSKSKFALNTIKYDIDQLKRLLFFKKYIKEIFGKCKLDFNSIYFYNNDVLTYNIFYACSLTSKQVKCFRFEEGYSTYITKPNLARKLLLILKIRDFIWRLPELDASTELLYLFDPDLYQGSEPCKQIEKNVVEEAFFKEIIRKIFDIDNILSDYDKPFIVFEESFYADGYDIGDFELFQELINEIGADRFMIKLHPRDNINRFKDMGVKINSEIGIPWEAVLLSGDFRDKVFITISSGSVINARLLLNNSTPSIMLYKCMDKRFNHGSGFIKFMNKFEEKYGKTSFYAPDSTSDAKKCLSLLNNKKVDI